MGCKKSIHLIVLSLLSSFFLVELPTPIKAQSSYISAFPEVRQAFLLNQTHAINRLEEEDYSINTLYQNYLNLLSDINYVDFSAFAKVRSHHQIGIIANSFKEGPYIGMNNFMGQYSYKIKVKEKASLSLGTRAGYKSIVYDGGSSGVSGTYSAPDLALDIALQHQNYFAYYAVGQLVSSVLKQGITPVKLKRFHEVRGGIKINVGRKSYLFPQIHLRTYEQQKVSYGGSLSFNAYSIVTLGIGTYDLNSLIYQMSLSTARVERWNISFLGSFRQLIGSVPRNLYTNSVEVGIKISKKSTQIVYDDES